MLSGIKIKDHILNNLIADFARKVAYKAAYIDTLTMSDNYLNLTTEQRRAIRKAQQNLSAAAVNLHEYFEYYEDKVEVDDPT